MAKAATNAKAVTNMQTTVAMMRARLAAFLGQSHGGSRDFYQVFGYERQLTIDHLAGVYYRDGLARRIISCWPAATWSDVPRIADEEGDSAEKGESYSRFAEQWSTLCKDLKLLSVLERADRLSGVGQYGVLVMGFSDGKPLDQPLNGYAKLMYVSPYSHMSARIIEWERNTKSPRFGLPIMYQITQNEMTTVGDTLHAPAFRVHYSRVMHIAEHLEENEVYGTPRLMPVFNRLQDLEKVLGGSAETFWLTANRGVAYWLDKEADLDAEELKAFKGELEDFGHQLRRTILGRGMTAQPMGSDVPDPQPNIDMLLSVIAGATGIPKRMLIGNEQGQLASTQDDSNWSSRVDERRRNFALPRMLLPFIQKMIDTGNLPRPRGKWTAEWPKTDLGEQAQADILTKRTGALVAYANSPTASLVVPMQEFRRDFLHIDAESDYEGEAIEDPLDESTDDAGEGDIGGDSPDGDGGPPVPDAKKVNAAPKTLYVSRRVMNTKAIRDWAKKQGIAHLVDDLHVTVMYSTTPVDWMKAQEAWSQDENGMMTVKPGGPRVVERFAKGAVVLSFSSKDLAWRHHELLEMGACHGFSPYQPHVTLTYDASVDASKIEAYQGPIVLGPEIFKEAKV